MSPLQSNDGPGKEVQQKHMKKVPLHLIFDAIESANDVYDQYLDTKEMNVIMLGLSISKLYSSKKTKVDLNNNESNYESENEMTQ